MTYKLLHGLCVGFVHVVPHPCNQLSTANANMEVLFSCDVTSSRSAAQPLCWFCLCGSTSTQSTEHCQCWHRSVALMWRHFIQKCCTAFVLVLFTWVHIHAINWALPMLTWKCCFHVMSLHPEVLHGLCVGFVYVAPHPRNQLSTANANIEVLLSFDVTSSRSAAWPLCWFCLRGSTSTQSTEHCQC